MQNISLPLTRDLVLVGGGHTHALLLRAWGMKPLPGVRVTLVNPDPAAAYSGMLPGHVAGHYDRAALDIDLVRLAGFAGVRMILGRATGIDREQRLLRIEGAPDVGYDVLSLDVGITSAMHDLPGFDAHGTPAKPLGPFAEAWHRYLARGGTHGVAVLGGGVAGVELALAMRHRLRAEGRDLPVRIVERHRALDALGEPARRTLLGSLAEAGVTLREGCTALCIHADRIDLEGGDSLPADFVVGAAGAVPYPWLAETGLADATGFVPVDPWLRSRDRRIFAVGDCAELTETPRPKAGVYAVRQAPVLLHNLRAALAGTGGLRRYAAQKDYLKLVSLGTRSALGERFGFTASGPALWRLKDRIDRGFMRRFEELPVPPRPVLPWPRAESGREEDTGADLCGGCGAKLGAAALVGGLRVASPGDDAALLDTGGARQVISTDHLRAFLADPVAMTRIAAVHALGDIWAMGARPQAATATVILPRQSGELATRHLREIMEVARETMAEAGAEIVGGHSTLGAEMTIGFTVTGLCERSPITLAGARPGDALVLTKPVGTGVVMAAHMRGRARGAQVVAAMERMMQPQAEAAHLLRHAHAMTDVTGFGLAGHLRNICAASGVGARLDIARVPLLPGAEDLAAAGIHSTLYRENRAGFDAPETPRAALMFDPQTGGGLLAAVDGDAGALCDALLSAGFEAAVVGEITDRPGQIEID